MFRRSCILLLAVMLIAVFVPVLAQNAGITLPVTVNGIDVRVTELRHQDSYDLSFGSSVEPSGLNDEILVVVAESSATKLDEVGKWSVSLTDNTGRVDVPSVTITTIGGNSGEIQWVVGVSRQAKGFTMSLPGGVTIDLTPLVSGEPLPTAPPTNTLPPVRATAAAYLTATANSWTLTPTETLPPTNTPPPPATTTPTMSNDDMQLTIQAEMAAMLGEATGTAVAGETATVMAWTPTFTPDLRQTAAAYLTATATQWTATPIPTIGAGNAGQSGNLRQLTQNGGADVLAFSPDGKLLAGGEVSGIIHIWDADTGEELQKMDAGTHFPIYSVAFSPDGKWLVSGSADNTARVWDVTTGAAVQTLGGMAYVYGVAFSPDGKMLACASTDGTLRRWNTETWQEQAPITAGARLPLGTWLSSIAFSPDGKVLAAGYGSNAVILWDAASGDAIRTIKIKNSAEVSVRALAFSPDGSLLAAGLGQDACYACPGALVQVMDVASGEAKYRFEDNMDTVSGVSFSPDGRLLAASMEGSVNKVRLWDVESGQMIAEIQPSDYLSPSSVTFSPDGTRLAIAVGGVYLWTANP